MVKLEKAIPLAYFITFTCYGTWLHGDRTTSVDRQFNIPGTDFLPRNTKRARFVKSQMTEEPYFLDLPRGKIVLKAIKNVCYYHQWSLLAAHVRTNHVHLVVHANIEPEKIMSTIKSYASRLLNELKWDLNRKLRWTRHGSTRYLWNEEEIEATIQYVIYQQGEHMAVFENSERKFVTLI
ncbi:MAG TPA: transposase [Legionellaceae bacterium]|nr:transposase [Legionellaceae bacterium]